MLALSNFSFQIEDSVAIVSLDRADVGNTITIEVLSELAQLQKEIEDNPQIRAVILCAQGSNFSNGMDINALTQLAPKELQRILSRYQLVAMHWLEMPIPVIAAVQGRCFGAGVEIILGCDMRFLSDDCELTLPEVRLGISPDLGGTTLLTRLVGLGQAKRLIMGCETIKADEARLIGLAEKVVPKDELMEASLSMAKRMASFPPLSMKFAKYGINLAAESSLKTGLLFEQAQSAACFGSEDMNEALAAFLEKRQPKFAY
ncbi:MAG: enoyl-CoA hydratase/isomerase family protein [Coriobacteriia bacterium]|nr:enoyl-CoA hydratase/isomerase family protein [Coriobacteriia bacterium]MCL2749822.1 enoyl-CoA hydratase/isomerase family protein [Coriobacteriia bacterium]